VKRHGRRPASRTASSTSRGSARSRTTERTAVTCFGRHPRVVQRDDRRCSCPAARWPSSAGFSASAIRAPAAGAALRPSAATRSAVRRPRQALPGRRQHRDVVHVPLEHVEQDVAAQPVGGDGVGGRGHDGRHRRVRAEARDDHPSAQVRSVNDTERAGQRHEHRARALLGSSAWPASRIGSVPWHSSGCVLISVATRTCSSGGAAAGAFRSTIDRATNRSTSGRGQQRADDVRRDAVADRCPSAARASKPVRQPGDHRRVPEQLARAEQVTGPARRG